MATALEELANKATQLVSESGRVEDLEKAASIAKMAAEVSKQNSDAVSQAKTLRYEGWKSFATLIVPLLTVATLFVTVYIQYQQISATREANEDTEWRESVKLFAGNQ